MESAIDGLEQGIQYEIVENEAIDGTPFYGYFYVVISPFTDTLQEAVYSAIDAIRGLSIRFDVFAASDLTANVTATVTAAPGYTLPDVEAAVKNAIESFIASIPLGGSLLWTQLFSSCGRSPAWRRSRTA
ncbi:baseplate J/gp47 family protein [Paraburkholderia sp. SOS3]|uniref:baseplate J/gp47 family protein n=1 Tax=Paraburkholderia sp. SOS3 TaxID=1926494 RepID=UPI0018DECD54|nr:baseplate J/gp47 family protein [Paraburkholderia sp. SOS3]